MNIKQIEKKIHNVIRQEGRRPRILLAHVEPHQTDRWTKPLAAALAEFGFDVDISPTDQTPQDVARLAIDNDVHMVCVSLSDIANQPLAIQLADSLQMQNSEEICLVVGGTGSQSNKEELYLSGVDLIVNFDRADSRLAKLILDLL